MLSVVVVAAASVFFSLANAFPPTPPGTVFCHLVKLGAPITAITPHTGVAGKQLAVDTVAATLENVGFTGGYTFTNGGIAAFDGCHNWYLNIKPCAHSYKPLEWDFDDQETTTWIASEGAVVKAGATAQYQETSKFLACGIGARPKLYLQTGYDVPSPFCVTTQLFANTTAAPPSGAASPAGGVVSW